MIYIIASVLLYTAVIMIMASASRNANTNLVTFVSNLFSVAIPFFVAVPLLSKKTFHSHKYGILMSVLAGVILSLFALSLNKAYSQNKIGIIAPIVFGGAIFLSTILSYFIFKEKIDLIEGIGLIFVGLGFAIIIYARAVA